MLHSFWPILRFTRAGVTFYCSTLSALSFFFSCLFFFLYQGRPTPAIYSAQIRRNPRSRLRVLRARFPASRKDPRRSRARQIRRGFVLLQEAEKGAFHHLQLIIHLIYRTGSVQADKRFFTLLKREFTWAEVCVKPVSEIAVSHGPTRRSRMM